ncbi:MAG TPA: shikimate dehydrogenase [Egibacteraceae bacterium]|nr:shikimate dehydrogenase [Egibacteraceae bacterium]
MDRLPTSSTRLACVLGHPVAHSVSPQMHNAAFAEAGIDAVYVALDISPDDIAQAVAGLGALGVLGVNVTVPHKRAVWELAQRRAPEAEAVGAANTLWWEDGLLVADNTDAPALVEMFQAEVGLTAGDPVLLFGAGGAARAAAVALGRAEASVKVVARQAEAAATVAELAAASGAEATAYGTDQLSEVLADASVVVNATSLGLAGERLADPLMALRGDQIAVDLIYGRSETPFLLAARSAGAAAHDGLSMLVGQAALSFERWTGVPAPVETMRAAARAALGR